MKQLFLILISLLITLKAYAHPHIWVDTDLSFVTDGQKITAIDVNWQFDEMYSGAFMLDVDLNKDNKLDSKEQKAIETEVMSKAVNNLRPFILLYFNGKKNKDFEFTNLKITYDEKTEKINYNFRVKLNTPQTLKGSHKVAILDKEYYIGFEQSYDFVIPSNCSFELEEDKDIVVYDGLINPETYKVICK